MCSTMNLQATEQIKNRLATYNNSNLLLIDLSGGAFNQNNNYCINKLNGEQKLNSTKRNNSYVLSVLTANFINYLNTTVYQSYTESNFLMKSVESARNRTKRSTSSHKVNKTNNFTVAHEVIIKMQRFYKISCESGGMCELAKQNNKSLNAVCERHLKYASNFSVDNIKIFCDLLKRKEERKFYYNYTKSKSKRALTQNSQYKCPLIMDFFTIFDYILSVLSSSSNNNHGILENTKYEYAVFNVYQNIFILPPVLRLQPVQSVNYLIRKQPEVTNISSWLWTIIGLISRCDYQCWGITILMLLLVILLIFGSIAVGIMVR